MSAQSSIPITLKGPHGSASLPDFANVITTLRTCLKQLSRTVAEVEEVEYEISELRQSSAFVAVSPVANGVPETVLDEMALVFQQTATAIQNGTPLDDRLDYAAIRAFRGFSSVIRKKGNRLTIGTTTITRSYVARIEELLEPEAAAFGSVTGRLESITIHGRSRFTLYPPIPNEEVECLFDRGAIEKVLDAVDRNVTVYGLLYYGKAKIYPVRVRVDDFETHPPADGLPTLLDACGMMTHDVSSDRTIEEIRNDWT